MLPEPTPNPFQSVLTLGREADIDNPARRKLTYDEIQSRLQFSRPFEQRDHI